MWSCLNRCSDTSRFFRTEYSADLKWGHVLSVRCHVPHFVEQIFPRDPHVVENCKTLPHKPSKHYADTNTDTLIKKYESTNIQQGKIYGIRSPYTHCHLVAAQLNVPFYLCVDTQMEHETHPLSSPFWPTFFPMSPTITPGIASKVLGSLTCNINTT